MQVIKNDIWREANKVDAVVIPTNIGWRRSGSNVMGRGIASYVSKKWVALEDIYGAFCRKYAEHTGLAWYDVPEGVRLPCGHLLLMPVKPLNKARPYMSWHSRASIPLIKAMTGAMQQMVNQLPCTRILVPSLGCGNGQLDKRVVWPILHKNLLDPKFVLVDPKPLLVDEQQEEEGKE